MRHLDLFSGIGGFSIASDAVWENNDDFCQKVLQKHWESCKIYSDIRDFTWQGYVQDAGKKDFSEDTLTEKRTISK